MNKKISFINILLVILQIVSSLGAYAVDYFTESKMGMKRHVVFKNTEFEKGIFNPFNLKIFIGLMILILLVLLYRTYIERKEFLVMNVFNIIILSFGTSLSIILNTTKRYSYYYIVIFTLIIAFLTILRLALVKTIRINKSK